MKALASFMPKNLFLFVLPDKLISLRYGLGSSGKGSLKESQSFALEGPHQWVEVLARVSRQHRPTPDDSWFLGLPLRLFTAVSFTLPQAATQNLDQAVHYGLMSQVPFDLQNAYTHYTRRERGDQLDILATVALREQLRPYLEAVSAAGITLSVVLPSLALAAGMNGRDGVYVSGGEVETEILAWKDGRIVYQSYELHGQGGAEAGLAFLRRTRTLLENTPAAPDGPYFFWQSKLEPQAACLALGVAEGQELQLDQMGGNPVRLAASFPYQIDLVPQAVLRRRRIGLLAQVAALALLALSLLAYPLAQTLGKRHHLLTLENAITQTRLQTDKLSGVRKANQDAIDHLQKVGEYVRKQPVVSELLKEITEVMPQDSWLESFTFSGEKLFINGQAGSATAVLEALENSPLFAQVHFDSQIVKTGEREVFKIVAGLEQ